MNARFWTWWGCDAVKITLRPGRHLFAFHVDLTEEGRYEECEMWSFSNDGQTIKSQWHEAESDCDGQAERSVDCECHVLALRQGRECTEDKAIRFPKWRKVRSGQRDCVAEAAGY
ncbi:MAG: hypothetical protein V1755_14750 [Chloroflexota bacterium]